MTKIKRVPTRKLTNNSRSCSNGMECVEFPLEFEQRVKLVWISNKPHIIFLDSFVVGQEY